MFVAEAVYTRYRYHTDNQLDNARRKWLPDDDFLHRRLADVCFVRVRLPSPSRPQQPCQVLLHCPTTALSGIVLDGGGARTHTALELSRRAKTLVPQPKRLPKPQQSE